MSLSVKIYNHLKENYPSVIHKGELRKLAVNEWGFENENMGRRCRELENKGLIKRFPDYKGRVQYQYVPLHGSVSPFTRFITKNDGKCAYGANKGKKQGNGGKDALSKILKSWKPRFGGNIAEVNKLVKLYKKYTKVEDKERILEQIKFLINN